MNARTSGMVFAAALVLTAGAASAMPNPMMMRAAMGQPPRLSDGESVSRNGQVTRPDGVIVSESSTISRSGDTVTRDAARSNSNGKSVVSHDSWTRDSSTPHTIEHSGTTTTADGKVISRESTSTREGNTRTTESVTIMPDGRQVTREIETTRDGDTVTREATITRPDGKTITREDSWTRDGNAVTHHGETKLPNGNEITRDSMVVRDGNSMTRQGTTTGPKGRSASSNDTWRRAGNTINHSGSTTGSGGKSSLRESQAIIGKSSGSAMNASAIQPQAAPQRKSDASGSASGGNAAAAKSAPRTQRAAGASSKGGRNGANRIRLVQLSSAVAERPLSGSFFIRSLGVHALRASLRRSRRRRLALRDLPFIFPVRPIRHKPILRPSFASFRAEPRREVGVRRARL